VSHLFQRPLCEMGSAYDFAYRPALGAPNELDGGGCDDRPHRAELYAATADPTRADAPWRAFSLCPEHETQLRQYDERLRGQGIPPRFRSPSGGATAPASRGR
jgi:hypothetical protein